jgi:hypothetical protein
MPRRLRPVGPDETAEKPRRLSVTRAASEGTHRELLMAVEARIAEAVQAPNCHPVALAALSRQLVSISKELSAITVRDDEDEIAAAAAIPDEVWNGTV